MFLFGVPRSSIFYFSFSHQYQVDINPLSRNTVFRTQVHIKFYLLSSHSLTFIKCYDRLLVMSFYEVTINIL